ncbi:peptidylprolyl isomerase [Angustibacter sp. McL0619]|uniref:peptidylprolyl isomerase n=1 Tax=Angustibacter sp. McL0619 TaxID=3415676 RepID=UPI003CECE0FD
MPIERDRERAKRRYARRQKKLAERAAEKKRNQQVIGAVVAVLLVAAGVVLLTQLLPDDSNSSSTGATSSPSANASGPASAPTKTAKSYPSAPPKSLAEGATWNATMVTSAGDITMELYGDKAPQTVSSFIFLSKDGYYDDTSCHRLTTEGIYVLQCGDPTGTGTGGPGYQYGMENAPEDGKYPAGTLAMARGSDPGSNGSQFFMVYKDTVLPTDSGGYSIFGKVTNGLDVLQQVAAKGTSNGTGDGPPAEPVTIKNITVEKQ